MFLGMVSLGWAASVGAELISSGYSVYMMRDEGEGMVSSGSYFVSLDVSPWILPLSDTL